MRAPALLVVLALGCSREEARPPVVAAPVAEAPAEPLWQEVAPGIALHRTTRAYDDHVARVFVARLALARAAITLRALPEHRFAPLLEQTDLDVAVNGGFFEPDFAASGLVVVDRVELAPPNERGGSGVLVVADDRARIVPFEAIDASVRGAALAVQCGPRLLEADGSIGILRDAGQRAARTAVCVRDGGRTLDLVVAFRSDGPGGPGLLALAEWLHEGLVPGEGGCEAALNLDGGPSTALLVRGRPEARRLPPGPVVHALVARAKP